MFGNRLGWCIAALIAVGFVLLTRQLAAVNRLTPPTALLAGAAAFEPLTPEVPLASLYAATAPGDARVLYQQAIDSVTRSPGRYARLEASDDPLAIETDSAVSALVAAASRPGEPLGDLSTRISYGPANDDLDALLTAGRCAGRAAVLRAAVNGVAADPTKAKSLFDAQFALGAKLFEHRVRQTEAEAGLAMAREAAGGLRDLAARGGDARRAALLGTFDRSAAGLESQRIAPVWNAIGALDGNVIAEHAGDVYALAGRACHERVWRVEAVLALGKHRFNLDRPADRLTVPRRLDELESGETDAAVVTAIRAARGLTLEQFRTVR